MSTRDRLKKKLEDKKRMSSSTPVEKQPTHPIVSKNTPVMSYDENSGTVTLAKLPVFHLITRQNDTFKEKAISNEHFSISERHRHEYIRGMVKKQSDACKLMTPEQLAARKREIVIALHDKWVDSFINSLSIIEYSDKPEFTEARFFKWYNHTIIALDIPADKYQMRVDYLCLHFLRWFQHNDTEDDGKDILISLHSLRLFFYSMVGYEFYSAILEDEFMMSLCGDFNTDDIIVVSKTLGQIYLPKIDICAHIFREYTRLIPFWSQVANPFSF
jgi:hypothetical protein